MKKTFLWILPLLIASVIIMGCDQGATGGEYSAPEVTAGGAVTVDAADTFAVVTFAGVRGRTLTAADFEVDNGATISTDTGGVVVTGDVVMIIVQFAANTGAGVNVYTVSIKADSPIFCAEEVTITQEGILPRAPLVLTSSATVNAGANQTAVNITFSGAASFLDDSDPVTDDEEDSARLKASDFTASGIGGIGKVSTTGNIVTVTVTLIRNTTATPVVVTAGVNPVSSKVTGSAAAVTITQSILPALTPVETTYAADPWEHEWSVEFEGATDLVLEPGDFTTTRGSIKSVVVSSDIATVTVNLIHDFHPTVTVVGVSNASAAISSATPTITITQEPLTVLEPPAAAVVANNYIATVVFTGATGLSLTKADFVSSVGSIITGVDVTDDNATVTVLLISKGIEEFTVTTSEKSESIAGHIVADIINENDYNIVVPLMNFETSLHFEGIWTVIGASSGGGAENLTYAPNPNKTGNTSGHAFYMMFNNQGGGRAAQLNFTTPTKAIEFDWLPVEKNDNLLFRTIFSIQDNIGNDSMSGETYPNKYITFMVIKYDLFSNASAKNAKIYYFIGNPNASLLGEGATTPWGIDWAEFTQAGTVPTGGPIITNDTTAANAATYLGADLPEWIIDTGVSVDALDKWYRVSFILNAAGDKFDVSLYDLTDESTVFELADEELPALAGYNNGNVFSGTIKSLRFAGSRRHMANHNSNGGNLYNQIYFDNIIMYDK